MKVKQLLLNRDPRHSQAVHVVVVTTDAAGDRIFERFSDMDNGVWHELQLPVHPVLPRRRKRRRP